MGRAYVTELERLKQTVGFACDADIEPLAALLVELVTRNLIFVGSGGSYTAATFAAALHEQYTGRLTKALTPLEAVHRPSTNNTAAVLISARGSNPDIIKAFHSLRFKEPIAAICANERSTLLRQINDSGIGVGYGFTVPGGKDGFLATNSLLATLVLLSRSYGSLFRLPEIDMAGIGDVSSGLDSDSHLSAEMSRLAGADTIIALSSGWGWPAATDLESKCSESGLTNVLLSDFRNFAHGRHNWLRTRAMSTAVVSIEDRDNTELAGSILQLVPDEVQKLRLFSDRTGPGAAIDLVSQVLHFVGFLGAASAIDPGRPLVEKFGRKMYRNGFKTSNSRTARHTWIARKAEAIGLLPHESDELLAESLDCFLTRLTHTPIQALVADYDGTLCGPRERYTGIGNEVAGSLNSLLAEGLILGIATGRGSSAHEDLRRAIASTHWDKVFVGLYNGAIILPLSEEVDERDSNHTLGLASIRTTLTPLVRALSMEMSLNEYQVSLRPSTPMDLELLRRSVTERLHDFATPVHVRRSAHSVDILPASISKDLVPRALAQSAGVDESAIVRIGDLGDWGGNDFELLNEGLSLSVDRISSRLDGCWNLGLPGSKGVTTTIHYLRALRPAAAAFVMEVDLLRRRAGGRLQ